MPHKKGRGGLKKIRVRDVVGAQYPHRKERCTVNIAPRCKGWVNGNTIPVPGVCKRCWQALRTKE